METLSEAEILARLAAAVGLGALVGIERGYNQHRAGLRTHALIALAAALFTVISSEGFPGGDPARVGAQIVSGVGFLGAGTILQHKGGTRGLTTAASVWMAAGLGMAAGVGLYVTGLVACMLALSVLVLMRPVNRMVMFLARYELRRSQLGIWKRSPKPEQE